MSVVNGFSVPLFLDQGNRNDTVLETIASVKS